MKCRQNQNCKPNIKYRQDTKISIVDEIPTKFRQNTIIFFNCRLPYIENDEERNSCRKRRTWEAILN